MLTARRFGHLSLSRYLVQISCASSSTNAASPLSQLRKKTGYSLSHCRAALQQFNDNLEQAEAWLHQRAQAEGWSRATKLQSRAASQGLVGIATKGNVAAMVEINCETDFVAKNEKFQQLVSQVATSLLKHSTSPKKEKIFFNKDTLGTLKSLSDPSKTLADMTALCVGALGENVILRRGVVLNATEKQHLANYCHGQINSAATDNCRLGKYGALVNYSLMNPSTSSDQNEVSSPVMTRSFPFRTIGDKGDKVQSMELSTYLDEEDESHQMHEYLNGYVYALPSRDSAQDLLLKHVSNQIQEQHLPNAFVLPLDMRVQTPDPTYIYYPGLCVSHRAPKADQAVVPDPVLLVELVTPTTERLILHEKAMNYRRIQSLKQIIYVWPQSKSVQVDVRDGDSSSWKRTTHSIDEKISLTYSFGRGELVLGDIFNEMTEQFGRLLAQHIVATRSRTIGFNEKKGLGQDESRLLFQKWMHTDDKTKTVQHFLNENQLNVNDFVRFECGEQDESTVESSN